MNLSDPDARRGLRSVVMAVVVIGLLVLVWLWAERLTPEALREVVRGALILIGIAQLGYQFENGMRAFKGSLSKDGLTFEAQGEAEAAVVGAQIATDAATQAGQAVVEELKP
jgi:hypothetical protein